MGIGRRRPLRWVIVLLVLVAAAFFGANELATSAAQTQLASRAQSATGAASASATVGPFPMLAHLLGQGTVPRVTVVLHDVAFPVLQSTVPGLPHVLAQQVDVDLRDVHVSRSELIRSRKVVVTAIGSATISVTVTASGLSSEVGLPVTLPGAGRVRVSVHGLTAAGAFRIVDGDTVELIVGGAVVSSVALRKGNLLPACTMVLGYAPGQLTATCTMTPVPASIVAARAAS